MPTILIIDDDPDICEILRGFLSKRGHRCLIANDGYTGTALALKEKPALILLDINMPAGGADSVLNNLRVNSNTAALPVICITSMPRQDAMRKITFNQQIRGIFQKPIDMDKLDAKIVEVVGQAPPPGGKTP